MSRLRPVAVAVAVALVVAACGRAGGDPTSVEALPPFDADDLALSLERSPRPAVVNVWASWCAPCRSEAPLLAAAAERFGDQVDFIGVDVEDTQEGARGFIAEFGITYPNLFDPDATVRRLYGGTGVPITYFVAADGSLVSTHFGVIDEQALALGIDELIRLGDG